MPRDSRREAGLVVLVAVLVRAIHLLRFSDSPFFASPILDAAAADELARRVAAGDWTVGAPWFRPPLYPWVLGAAYALAGDGVWPGRILGGLAGTGTALAVWWTAVRLALPRWGRLASGLAVSLVAPELFFEAELLATALATALAGWSLFFAVDAACHDGDARRWGAAAVLAALAALARAPLALVPGVWLLLAVAGTRRWQSGAVVLLVTGAVWAGPVAMHAQHGGGVGFPATQGGVNFWIGNHPGADGRGVDLSGVSDALGWREFEAASRRTANRETGRELGPAEASAYWRDRGLAFWRSQPVEALRLSGLRLYYALHGYETPNNRSLYEARADSVVLRALLWEVPGFYFPTGLIVPLALLGAWHRRRDPAWRPVIALALTVVLPLTVFFVCSRFRMPALAPAVLLAVAGAGALRTRPRILIPVAVGLILLLNAPWSGAVRSDPARDALARGEAALNAGRTEQAVRAYRRTLQLDPGEGRAYLGLAAAAMAAGTDSVEIRLRQAEAMLPGYWAVQALWGDWERRRGDVAGAVERYGRAVQQFPESPRLLAAYGLAIEASGQPGPAEDVLERAWGLGLSDPEALNSLGRFRRLAGRPEAAEAAWRRALEHDPDHFKTRFNLALHLIESGRVDAGLLELDQAARLAPDAEAARRVTRARNLVDRRP